MPFTMPTEIAAPVESPTSSPENSAHKTGLSLGGGRDGFGLWNYSFRLDLEDRSMPINDFSLELGADCPEAFVAKVGENLEIRFTIERLAKAHQYVLSPTLINRGSGAVVVRGFAFGQLGEDALFLPGPGHPLGWALKYAHTGNLRTERYPYCAADYPYVRHLPTERRVLGDTEDQPFPALFLQNEVSRAGIVLGLSTQKKAAPVFDMQRRAIFRPDAFESFELRWDFPQSRGYRVEAGEEFEFESLYLQLTEGVNADWVFEDYLNHISERNDFLGSRTPLNQAALHCTWNYGVFADQRRATLIDTARFISENLPEIKYFLIDDGYLEHTSETNRVFLNRFYPSPEEAPVSNESWPQGLRGFSEEIQAMGLKPGLWWTPTVRLPCQLHDEHPEWFLRRKDGSLYLIGGNLAYLDYSHPEAIAFLDRVLKHIIGEWGIAACKIDFYSQNFETRDAQLWRANCSSLEVRRDFMNVVRRYLPENGIIMSCIAMGMGNPFLGELVDTFRCSMDIGDGSWSEQVNNSRWSLPTLSYGGRRTFLLNMDSVGISTELSEAENLFRLTWCYITMGLIETGGRLENLAPNYLSALKKLLQRCDRGYPCRCPDLRAYTGSPLPEVLYVDFPSDSPTAAKGIRQSVAFLNWQDVPHAVSIARQALGHTGAVRVENFWTGEKGSWSEDFVTIVLPAHSAQLYDILAES